MNKNICEICLNKTSKLNIPFPFFRHSDFKTYSYNLNLDKYFSMAYTSAYID